MGLVCRSCASTNYVCTQMLLSRDCQSTGGKKCVGTCLITPTVAVSGQPSIWRRFGVVLLLLTDRALVRGLNWRVEEPVITTCWIQRRATSQTVCSHCYTRGTSPLFARIIFRIKFYFICPN